MQQSWDIPAAISLYNIDRWGLGYFTINELGNIAVSPTCEAGKAIDIMELIAQARSEFGLGFPMVLRFQDLLHHRVVRINKAFADAIAEAGYRSVRR